MYKDPNDPRAKESRRKHYEKNKQAYKDRARANKRELQEFVWALKRKPCMDCGREFIEWIMQFDHRPEETKVANISVLVGLGNKQKLIDELAKCDLVCANCHIMRTALRGNWKKNTWYDI